MRRRALFAILAAAGLLAEGVATAAPPNATYCISSGSVDLAGHHVVTTPEVCIPGP